MEPLRQGSIDQKFMVSWESKYEVTENDQPKYDALVKKVASDISEYGTLRWDTFTRIMIWKSTRVMSKVDKTRVHFYQETIRQCLATPEAERLKFLTCLPGVAEPVSSTILHFIYPNTFPIIDQRTVEALVHFGLLKSKSTSVKNYSNYFNAIHDIRTRLGKWNLRQIDRAIFAFHKQSKLFGPLGGPSNVGGNRNCRD